MPSPDDVSLFGQTTYHRRFAPFGIRQADRFSHLFVLGKTGSGKSSLLETLARADLEAGRGFAFIDPHGDVAERLVATVPEGDQDRLIYLNAPDRSQPFGYNPLRRVRDDLIPLAASGVIETFRKLWSQAWGTRMEHILRNSVYALLEQDHATLADIPRLYADKTFRQSIARSVRNPVVRAFWAKEYPAYPPRLQAEMIAPVLNKLGAVLSDPTLYRMLVEPKEELRFRRLMDGGSILIVNLAKGRLGEDSASALGSLLISTLGLAALSRLDTIEVERRPFHVFADEFQTFTTLAFASQMAELRKVRTSLTLATQHLAQMEDEVRHAVIGNAGSLISFRLGAEDAGVIAKEFQPVFGVEDLINLPNRYFYTRLMIDGSPSRPFSGRTMTLPDIASGSTAAKEDSKKD